MKSVSFLLASLLVLAAPVSAQTLVWSDEFNGEMLDPSGWNYETGTGINGNWGTCQVDAATDRPENVSISHDVSGAEGGALTITTRREPYGDRSYTSGRINTEGHVSWGPGHQLRARVWPRDVRYEGQGFAFWAMPTETPPGDRHLMWPQGGEIDIMEYNGLFPYNNLGSVHYAWDWAGNAWRENNHAHQGAYYSYASEEVPEESPQWIYVDLGESHAIDRVVLRWETAFGSAYRAQVSDDARTWTDLYSTTSGNGSVDDLTGLGGSGRYVRVHATERGTSWGYSLWELEVYGEGDENLALDQPAVASTAENEELTPEHAVDGNYTTRWASGNLEAEAGPRPPDPDDPAAGLSGWHVYGIDWYDDHIDFLVDGHVYHRHYFEDGGAFAADGSNQEEVQIVDGQRIVYSEYSNHYGEWHPFEHEFFVILSSGVGGSCTYGGAIAPEAEFPASVFVDWVRVYSMGEVATEDREQADTFALLGSRPNPFSATTQIAFQLPTSEHVTLEVFNLVGQQVATLVDGPRPQGLHEVTFDASALPSGMYLYRLQAGSFAQSMRLVLLR